MFGDDFGGVVYGYVEFGFVFLDLGVWCGFVIYVECNVFDV